MSVDLKQLQADLKNMGLLPAEPDGKWGPQSHGAFLKARALVARSDASIAKMSATLLGLCKATAWSAKQTPQFVSRVKDLVAALGMPPTGADDLMACMAWESGESFSAGIVNKAGSGATGLIQFMPGTAIVYFNSAAEIAKMSEIEKKEAGLKACRTLAAMSDVQQLDYVLKYFQPYKGKLKNLGDLYMSILWPLGIGKDDSYVLWTAEGRPTTFRQNSGLDVNKDGAITRAECLVKVNDKLVKGLHPDFLRAA
jgi:hypothetical protein